ncbi:MAG: hypothetical protein IPG29_16660 [Sphingobacteriales bacterium]|nr:hypothetical protein [Sphingobacteriales bacterium]
MYNYIINGFNIILLFLLVFFQLNKVQAQITPAGATNNELATIKLTAIADTFVVRSERETVFNLLTNDKMGYSPEVHRIKIVAEPKNGKAKVIQEKGVDKIAYTYAAQDERGDEFVYEICDPKKDCSQATILVVKCPPVAGGFPQAEEVFIRKGQSHTASFESISSAPHPTENFQCRAKLL